MLHRLHLVDALLETVEELCIFGGWWESIELIDDDSGELVEVHVQGIRLFLLTNSVHSLVAL